MSEPAQSVFTDAEYVFLLWCVLHALPPAKVLAGVDVRKLLEKLR